MNTEIPLALLAGLCPHQFMRRYWQKKPLLIRQAIPGFGPLIERRALLDLAAKEGVESRLVVQTPPRSPARASSASPARRKAEPAPWSLTHGPFARRALPPLTQRQWTLLVQGADTHSDAVHALLQQFRFVPDARLDDVMISFATDGGGVGPHFDSYDVFLLQAHGRRRWRIGRQKDFTLQVDVPLKILANFSWEEEFVLEPGDMLYLPPRYAHDGVAEGECMTYSVGFRAPERQQLGLELAQLLVDELAQDLDEALTLGAAAAGHADPAHTLYRDPAQSAVSAPAAIPPAMQEFAQQAFRRALARADAVPRWLGENLTEPKASTWFDAPDAMPLEAGFGAGQVDAHDVRRQNTFTSMARATGLAAVTPPCCAGWPINAN